MMSRAGLGAVNLCVDTGSRATWQVAANAGDQWLDKTRAKSLGRLTSGKLPLCSM